MEQTRRPFRIYDYDALGVGARRKHEFTSIADSLTLVLHPQLVPQGRENLYRSLVEETVAWLKPKEILEERLTDKPEFVLQNLLEHDFQVHFPETFAALGAKAKPLLQQYLQEFPWQGPLLTDHFRYFSQFLKPQVDFEVLLFAQQEWFRSYLAFTDFGSPRLEPGLLKLNPSLQPHRVPERIGIYQTRQPGLYIYFYDARNFEVRELALDWAEATILDLLEEERKFTQPQVLDQLVLSGAGPSGAILDREGWIKKLSNLISQGMILESPTKEYE